MRTSKCGIGHLTVVALMVLLGNATLVHAASAPKVVASILPVHSLVARVMQGVGTPVLLVRPGASPHGYAMRPSDARAVADADAVFWIGPTLENWLEAPLESLAERAKTVALNGVEGLHALPPREGGTWPEHTHDAHATGDDHGEHDTDHSEDHEAHGAVDPHTWLDPDNAKIWLNAIAAALAAIDPANAAAYQANARAERDALDATRADVDRLLRPVKERPFVVFHDAYQYFERRFELTGVGAVALGNADKPGAARFQALRNLVEAQGVVCVFAEPQFPPKLIETLVDGTDVRIGKLDLLGASLQPGPDLYSNMLQNLAHAFADCLGG